MPYVCTHLSFGNEVAEAIGETLDSLGEEYVLGCFGPDVYFYDRLPPTPFVPHRKKHGNALHQIDCAALFAALVRASDDATHTYLLGFLTHIALDSTLHPYVEAKHRGIDHTRFEGVIDSIVYAETKDAIPYREILFRRPDTRRIDRLLSEASEALTGESVAGAYRRSAKKFRRLVPFLFDPRGKRYRAVNWIERLFKKDGLLSAFLLAAPRADTEDCMNLSRAEWVSPFEPDRVRNESVPMLFDEAKTLAVSLIRAFTDGESETLRALLKNRTMQKGALV
ncbi:MAG: zinc dependent phospholipase C family protein [Clostridia bacterium]|nr:zinc dependent phospholipase C family protein [Clostridia bacterium]